MLNSPMFLFKLPQAHIHTPQDMPPKVSSQSSSPEQTMGGAQYYARVHMDIVL